MTGISILELIRVESTSDRGLVGFFGGEEVALSEPHTYKVSDLRIFFDDSLKRNIETNASALNNRRVFIQYGKRETIKIDGKDCTAQSYNLYTKRNE